MGDEECPDRLLQQPFGWIDEAGNDLGGTSQAVEQERKAALFRCPAALEDRKQQAGTSEASIHAYEWPVGNGATPMLVRRRSPRVKA